ncbi:MAG: nucleoside triphosphate pyrophosphatase [Pseudomonadota bacterium]
MLASGSRYRAELLARLRLPFTQDSADIDESSQPREHPYDLVLRLAVRKASVVAARHVNGVVIGSDQVAVANGEILGKPHTEERAKIQLRKLSGVRVRFYTGLCVYAASQRLKLTAVDLTDVQFRTLSDGEIERYVLLERPLDCAGAIKSEALGSTLFERIESQDPTGLIGLPLIRLAALLRQAGIDPLLAPS